MKFLLIGGLGDSIKSFDPWMRALNKNRGGYRYIPVTVSGDTGFSHRIQTLKKALDEEVDPVCIIGQSAGALAALMVASDNPKMVKGVIAVSPAMPKGISPLSVPLLSVMWKYYYHMRMSHLIEVTAKDYTKLALNNVSNPDTLLANRQKISGREAYELTADSRPALAGIRFPVVHIYGTEDRWVNPRVQTELFRLLGGCKSLITVSGAGHMPAHHPEKGAMVVNATLNKLKDLITFCGGART